MQRKIIHIDMDAFYASIEQRDFPELRGQPVAVGGSERRGVVASASYEARRYGVRSAMPSITAKRLCPDLVFVKHRFEVYREVSQQIRAIFYEYTDLVEPLSLDEAYLDVTHPKKGPASATLIAEDIRAAIFQTTGLTASAGVSFNKFLAKTASDENKPNGIKVVLPKDALAFMAALPIGRFHGIGKVTAAKMEKLGIKTGADLYQWSEVDLVCRFGKAGRHYYQIIRAEDNRPVNPNRIRKSIGAERTFKHDITDLEEMKAKLLPIIEGVYKHMQKKQNFGRTISLKAKTPDFTILTRSRSFARDVTRLPDLQRVIWALLEENIDQLPAVRLLGIAVSNLRLEQSESGIQLTFDFPEE